MTSTRRYCTQRFDTHTCELRHGHADFHRSEYGEPVLRDGKYEAQVVSWL